MITNEFQADRANSHLGTEVEIWIFKIRSNAGAGEGWVTADVVCTPTVRCFDINTLASLINYEKINSWQLFFIFNFGKYVIVPY